MKSLENMLTNHRRKGLLWLFISFNNHPNQRRISFSPTVYSGEEKNLQEKCIQQEKPKRKLGTLNIYGWFIRNG